MTIEEPTTLPNSVISKWISIEESLPPDDTFVIVWWKPRNWPAIGKYLKKKNTWRLTGLMSAVSSRDITHWAEIYKPK